MTPQYILRKSLCRPAHCWSAHVLGQGYVNKGELASQREDYDRQRRRTAECEIDNLGYAPHYSEPGYDQPERGVLTANWNVFPRDIDKVLERAGFAVEWSDEWTTCDECSGLVRTSPSGYWWETSYVERAEGTEITCFRCIDKIPASAWLIDAESHLLSDPTTPDSTDDAIDILNEAAERVEYARCAEHGPREPKEGGGFW